MKCPSCGSDQVVLAYRPEKFEVPYGPSVEAALRVDLCLRCDFKGDIDGVNDARITQAIADSTKASIPVMIAILEGNGYTLVYCERALRIPFGSFKEVARRPWVDGPGGSGDASHDRNLPLAPPSGGRQLQGVTWLT